MIILTFASEAFLTPRNILNILNQNAPLAIIASALTLVIIVGGFDLSTAAIFGVASVSAAWIAVNINPFLGLAVTPFIGIAMGYVNGVLITSLKVHSFSLYLENKEYSKDINIQLNEYIIPNNLI